MQCQGATERAESRLRRAYRRSPGVLTRRRPRSRLAALVLELHFDWFSGRSLNGPFRHVALFLEDFWRCLFSVGIGNFPRGKQGAMRIANPCQHVETGSVI